MVCLLFLRVMFHDFVEKWKCTPIEFRDHKGIEFIDNLKQRFQFWGSGNSLILPNRVNTNCNLCSRMFRHLHISARKLEYRFESFDDLLKRHWFFRLGYRVLEVECLWLEWEEDLRYDIIWTESPCFLDHFLGGARDVEQCADRLVGFKAGLTDISLCWMYKKGFSERSWSHRLHCWPTLDSRSSDRTKNQVGFIG